MMTASLQKVAESRAISASGVLSRAVGLVLVVLLIIGPKGAAPEPA